MSHISRTFEAAMAVSSIVAFLVQLTYALRIWRLSFNNMHLTIPIVVLAFVGLACGGGMIAKTIKDPSWDHTRVSNLPASLFYFSSIACDILIAASQVYLFHKSRTGIGRLGGLITKLTVLVVNVGLITSLDVTVFLILFLVCPHNGAFLVPYILMSHCYLNSFLSVLNSRILLRELVEVDNFVCPEFTFATISVPGSRATSQSLPCTRTDVCSVLGTDSNPASLVLSVEP
ncbi:hypothetical protein BV22DRAFT_1031720 [Leucogyrophana mollusca]|uniref:Uncharacterized protein n=1 Tax=Leucogyrophana mollusca TaxID=85980 RepID=A0ACB8BNN8_9AGAM|nr:hypothetical protein BV22DRAFT_1031720 [Leucogyrophana mollusca]